MGTRGRNQNLIQEESKNRINSSDAFSRAVQNFSLCMLSKDVRIKINKTIILPLVLYGYETLSFTLKEEHKLRVLEN
jgi:hypothetical protein